MTKQINLNDYRAVPATNLCIGCDFHGGEDLGSGEGEGEGCSCACTCACTCAAPDGLNCRGVIYKKNASAFSNPEGKEDDYCDCYNYDDSDEYRDVKLFPAILIIAPLMLLAGIIILAIFPIYKLIKTIKR